MGRRSSVEAVAQPETTTDGPSLEASIKRLQVTSAQVSTTHSYEVSPDPFGREAKHFTETRVLHRDVRVVLEGVDKYNNLIGSLYYPHDNSAVDLAMELVEHGFAKYLEWSANMMEDEARRRLKNAELTAKKARLRIWTNYVPPASDSKAIHDQNFSGKVIEVVSGDCIIVADDAVPSGSSSAERRVNLSSIRSPKMGNPRNGEKPASYAREAQEFLRTYLIGCQVNVSMEYSRKVTIVDGALTGASADSMLVWFAGHCDFLALGVHQSSFWVSLCRDCKLCYFLDLV